MSLVTFYGNLILALVTVLSLYQYKRYKAMPFALHESRNQTNCVEAMVLMLFMTLLIGLRPISHLSIFGDSSMYYHSYNLKVGEMFVLDTESVNLIWDNLFCYFAANDLGITNLFLLGDALYFGCTFLACRRLFPHDTNASYLVFLGAFSTFSYSYNGVKAGIAGAIFLLALSYYNKRWISIALVLVSWGFHHSMQLPVAVYVCTLLFKNPKWYLWAWAFCAVIALLHITFFQELFAALSDEGGQGYLGTLENDTNFGGAGGFRIDFLLYSAAPVYVGYKYIIKEGKKVSELYAHLLNTYVLTNAVWLLCMYASYTNRIAYLSWFMYPIVLIYPFLKENLHKEQYRTFSKVMLGHLGFTLFMHYVFYSFLK